MKTIIHKENKHKFMKIKRKIVVLSPPKNFMPCSHGFKQKKANKKTPKKQSFLSQRLLQKHLIMEKLVFNWDNRKKTYSFSPDTHLWNNHDTEGQLTVLKRLGLAADTLDLHVQTFSFPSSAFSTMSVSEQVGTSGKSIPKSLNEPLHYAIAITNLEKVS